MITQYELVLKDQILSLEAKKEFDILGMITEIDDAVEYIVENCEISNLAVEKAFVLAFKNGIFESFIEVGVGDHKTVPIPLSSCFKFLLLTNADECIFLHNHIKGSPITPSQDDLSSYAQEEYIANLLNIKILANGIIQDKTKWFDIISNEERCLI